MWLSPEMSFSYMDPLSLWLPEAHVLVRRGEVEPRTEPDRGLLDARPDAVQRGRLEDAREHHALVHELLDLVERGLALLPVALLGLLPEEVVDVGMAARRVRCRADDERLDAR